MVGGDHLSKSDDDILDRPIALDNLPSEGSALALDHITLRQLFEMGIIRLHSDGTIRYNSANNDDVASIQAYILSFNTYFSDIYKHWNVEQGSLGSSPQLQDTGSWIIEINSHTLAGGALNNSDVVGAIAAKKLCLAWVIVDWDTDPAAAYQFAWQEEDQANDRWTALTPTMNGNCKIWMYYYTSAAVNKGIQIDITGGAGAEVLNTIACYRQFS